MGQSWGVGWAWEIEKSLWFAALMREILAEAIIRAKFQRRSGEKQ